MDNVLFIDGMNFIYRASSIFGFASHKLSEENPLHCICNQPWNTNTDSCDQDFTIIFNFFRNLRPIIEQFNSHKCFFALEGHPQFRYDIFPDYKANRREGFVKTAGKKEMQAKVYRNKDEILRLLQYLPITIVKADNYESDDLIGTLCDNMKDEHLTIITNDKDYTQLLQRNYSSCQVYNPMKKLFMEAPEYPFIAYLSLHGDKADNIPALMTGQKALRTVNNPTLFGKFMSTMENRARFNMNRELIEFHIVPDDEIHLIEGVSNFPALKREFERMEFNSITNDKSWNKYVKTFDCLRF